MAVINPYLTFNGNCAEAFDFYRSVFGGEFAMKTYFKDVPSDTPLCKEDSDRIMHVSLPISSTVLMASDRSQGQGNGTMGDNFSIAIGTESEAEADKIFQGLSAGGEVTMPMAKTFWGAYFGMLKDKFGIQWMVNFDYR